VNLTSYQQKVHIDSIGSMNCLPDTKIQEENQQFAVPANSNSTLNFKELFLEYQQEKDAFLSSIIGQVLRNITFIIKKCISLSPQLQCTKSICNCVAAEGKPCTVYYFSSYGSFGGLDTSDMKKRGEQ
jgi:hypothetical protein